MFRLDLICHPPAVLYGICSVGFTYLLEFSHIIKIDVVVNYG